MKSKKILIIGKINIYTDSRTTCFLSYLKNKKLSYEYVKIPSNNFKEFSISSLLKEKKYISFFFLIIFLKLNLYNFYYSKLVKFIDSINLDKFDYIYVYDVDTFLSINQILNKKKIIWDARDYYPLHFTQKPFWTFLYSNFYETGIKKFSNNVKTFMTVSKEIKNKYEKILKTKFNLILSLPRYEKLRPSKIKNKIKIIHHGVCSPTRKIENYLEIAKILGFDYEVNCMLKITDKNYFNNLKKKASKISNFYFVNPVNLLNISKKISDFDISLIITDKNSINHEYSMPNKLFESINGRLCLVTSPSIEISKFIKKYKCGVVSNNYKLNNIAYNIKKLNKKKIFNYKIASNMISKKFSYDKNFNEFNKIFKYLKK